MNFFLGQRSKRILKSIRSKKGQILIFKRSKDKKFSNQKGQFISTNKLERKNSWILLEVGTAKLGLLINSHKIVGNIELISKKRRLTSRSQRKELSLSRKMQPKKKIEKLGIAKDHEWGNLSVKIRMCFNVQESINIGFINPCV